MYLKMSQLLKFEVLVNKEGHGSQILIKFKYILIDTLGFPGGASGKESTCQCRRCKRCGFDPWVGKIPWNRKWQPTLVFLPGKSHEQRSLVGYSPWDHKESDTSEHACTLYTIMSCRFLQKSSLA